MSEIKVNNGNIEDALKRFKRQCARNGVLQEVRKESIMKNQALEERKNQRLQEKENFNKNGTRLLYVFFLIIRISLQLSLLRNS